MLVLSVRVGCVRSSAMWDCCPRRPLGARFRSPLLRPRPRPPVRPRLLPLVLGPVPRLSLSRRGKRTWNNVLRESTRERQQGE